jgi:spore coat polysaccharide biosynthesis predicted glycosyltransferase SpsG
MICIISESNNVVGTGHFYESCTLASEIEKKGEPVLFFINKNIDNNLLNVLPCKYYQYNNLADDIYLIIDLVRQNKCNVVVTNLRKIDNSIIDTIKKKIAVEVVCIDELGHRPLGSDIIINPLIDNHYHDYGKACKAVKYFGPGYMIMRAEFSTFHGMTKKINKNIETISICMGGTDISNTTTKILSSIEKQDAAVNVILGGGFLHTARVEEIVLSLKIGTVKILKNIPNVADVFWDSDIVFCMGGNTLYELACLGVPAVTIYEDKHEKSSAACFQEKGFGVCLGQVNNIRGGDIISIIKEIDYRQTRQNQSECGRKIVDGRGLNRTIELIMPGNL